MAGRSNKKKEEIVSIKDEFKRIQEEHNDLDIMKYSLTSKDIDTSEIDIINYDEYYDEALKEATEMLDSLVELYLGDNKEIKENKYIANKVKDDSIIYADTIFLSKVTRLQLKKQLVQIDGGDNSARMHEVVNQTFRETRENIMFKSKRKTEMESYYKEFRKDLGLKDLNEENNMASIGEDDNIGTPMNNADINDYIRKVMTGDIESE